jgi:Icc-related predicted phosphoesterase
MSRARRPVRVAAVGDLHMRPGVSGRFRPALSGLAGRADLLLLAGDLTNGGLLAEAELLCAEVGALPVPTLAVLGNHDHDEGHGVAIVGMLAEAGVRVLDGGAAIVTTAAGPVGVAGVMGGGGGFPGVAWVLPQAGDEREAERRQRGAREAARLRAALAVLDCEVRIALMHFAPVAATLAGEPETIYPSLGCQALADAVDAGSAQLAVHGHAHLGIEAGWTPGGIPVRNVAHPVLRRPYAVYEIAAP